MLLGWDPHPGPTPLNEAIGEVANTAFATRRPGTNSQRSSREGYPAPESDTITQGSPRRRNTPPPAEERRPALSPRVDQMSDRTFTQKVSSKPRVPTVPGIGIANALLRSISCLPRGGNDVMVLLHKLQRVREAMSEGLEVSAKQSAKHPESSVDVILVPFLCRLAAPHQPENQRRASLPVGIGPAETRPGWTKSLDWSR